MNSLWLKENTFSQFPSLHGSIRTDVLIIGGGLCGLLCAYEFEKLGVDYIVAEGGRICRKTTGNTTAKITSQHGLIYNDIMKKISAETAEKYYRINEKAIEEYAKLCKDIDCSFERKDNYIYSLSSMKKLDDEMQALEKIGAKGKFFPSLSELPFDVLGAIRFSDQAQFDVLSFTSALSRKLNIYENSHVIGFDGNFYYGKDFSIKADKVIVATHFPIFNKLGGYSLKMYQSRSYVIALKNGKDVKGMYLDENEKGLSFRNHKDFLLIGSDAHRTGKTSSAWKGAEATAEKYYPGSEIAFRWASQDCMTLDKLPYIGRYSRKSSDLFVATGFNKWGMSLSMVAALILKDLIFGKTNDFTDIFSPSRSVLHPQLAVNTFETTINFLTPTAPRCPHLGCALKWNKQEQSWDCSCHGSRFSEKGEILDGPAN